MSASEVGNAGLCLKPKKCCFMREEVQHVISKHGIHPNPAKTGKVEQ